MKIYYCITYHNEPQEICDSLLSSLNSQKGINFDDFVFLLGKSSGGSQFPDLSPYENLRDRITFISKRTPLQGPGFTHQLLLDYVYTLSNSDDDYVTFAHVDDELVSEYALKNVQEILLNFSKTNYFSFAYRVTDYVKGTDIIISNRYPFEVWATFY